jgi:uncharacterized membrane protein
MTHIPGTGHPTAKRSLLKTIVWRVIATTDTFILAYFFASASGACEEHAAELAASIAGFEVLTKMILYYLHERGWSRVDWGLEDMESIDSDSIPVVASS